MNIQYPFLLIYRNESQPSVFVHTAAQDAQGGSGKLKNDEEVPLPTTEDGGDDDDDEDVNSDGPKAQHQGAIPKTPKPNYQPPNYETKWSFPLFVKYSGLHLFCFFRHFSGIFLDDAYIRAWISLTTMSFIYSKWLVKREED